MVQRGQVVQAGGAVGVLLAQRLPEGLKGLAEQRLGLGVVALGLVQLGQVIQAGGVGGVFLT